MKNLKDKLTIIIPKVWVGENGPHYYNNVYNNNFTII